jgi:5,10-methylene-tetrahydrofolate dehydrogenase/methenyl tetrahydrofolate cyclohydrolase
MRAYGDGDCKGSEQLPLIPMTIAMLLSNTVKSAKRSSGLL